LLLISQLRLGPCRLSLTLTHTHGSITSCLLICIFNCRKQFSDFNIIAHHREELEDFAQRFKLKKMGGKNFYDHSLAVFVLKTPL